MKSKKVLIFYSSIWNWHLSAAKAIKEKILQYNPYTTVILKDIRDFMNPFVKKIDEKLYWFVVKNFPKSFDNFFKIFNENGKKAINLENLPKEYPIKEIKEYINTINPDTILSTHYWSAQVLAILREKWLLLDKNIWWLHTDYFIGYFPRISARLDKTFLAHPALKKEWLKYWIYPDKVEVTGMPIYIDEEIKKLDKKHFLKSLWLNEKYYNILILWGKEGAIDYIKIINSIINNFKKDEKKLQIIAVCGKNKKMEEYLKNYKDISANISLKVFWLLDHKTTLKLMKSSDILITKPGGLTISEAIMFNKPIILVWSTTWHEKENATFSSKEGLAKLCQNYQNIGSTLKNILYNENYKINIIKKQENLKKEIKPDLIVDFTFNSTPPLYKLPKNFWKENWSKVKYIEEKLELLNKLAPSDIEIILSYSTSKTPQKIVWENPFWHISIKINSVVYSINHLAKPGIDKYLLHPMSLWDYLYGVKSKSPNMNFVSHFWVAYWRDSIWLRVKGIPKKNLSKMIKEIENIENEFKNWKLWNKYNFNCADIVLRILQAWGFNIKIITDILYAPTMPVDVFEKSYDFFSKNYKIYTVLYSQVVWAKSEYNFSQFPISLYKISNIIELLKKDTIERKFLIPINFHLGSFWDWKLILEKLSNSWEIVELSIFNTTILKILFNEIKIKTKKILLNNKLINKLTTRETFQHFIKEISKNIRKNINI